LYGRGQSRCLCARGRQSADQNTRLTALPSKGALRACVRSWRRTAHALPDRRCGRAQGYHGDTSRMFHVGHVSDGARRLCDVSKECLDAAITQCGPGVPIARIGQARAAHAGWGRAPA